MRNDLLSGDIERARIAAACVRSSYDIRDQYRRHGLKLIVGINGVVQEVDPDSPLLPDLSSLVPIEKISSPYRQRKNLQGCDT